MARLNEDNRWREEGRRRDEERRSNEYQWRDEERQSHSDRNYFEYRLNEEERKLDKTRLYEDNYGHDGQRAEERERHNDLNHFYDRQLADGLRRLEDEEALRKLDDQARENAKKKKEEYFGVRLDDYHDKDNDRWKREKQESDDQRIDYRKKHDDILRRVAARRQARWQEPKTP
jgi:hypothetical protein